MVLTTDQIDFIASDIQDRGVSFDELAESLLDHICCSIESSPEQNFDKAYQKALAAFGEEGLLKTQRRTEYLLIHKRNHQMKKTMFILGYIAVILSTTGLLFKIMHWPGANVMLIMGIAVLNFGFLPMYFRDRYRRAIG